MGRPPKYNTPLKAAQAAVYRHVTGHSPDSVPWPYVEDILKLTAQNCDVCGAEPMESMEVSRVDGDVTVGFNRVDDNQTLCKMCFILRKIATIQEVRSYAARVLAKRKHELDKGWVLKVPQ